MGRLIVAGASNPTVRETMVGVLREGNVPERNVPAMVEAIFRFWQSTYYVWDPWDAEWLQTVDRQLLDIANGTEGLDCDDKVIGLAAGLRSVGIPALVKSINGDPRSTELDHVYVLAGDPQTGEWVPLDPIQPDADPGWEPPVYREYLVYDPATLKVVERGTGPQPPPPPPRRPVRRGYRRDPSGAPRLNGPGMTGFGVWGGRPPTGAADLTPEELLQMRWWTDPRDRRSHLVAGLPDPETGQRAVFNPYTRAPTGTTIDPDAIDRAWWDTQRGDPPPTPPAIGDPPPGGGKTAGFTTNWLTAYYRWDDPQYERDRYSQARGNVTEQLWSVSGYDPTKHHSLAEARMAEKKRLDEAQIGGLERSINASLLPSITKRWKHPGSKAVADAFESWRTDAYVAREAWEADPQRKIDQLLRDDLVLEEYQREMDQMIEEALTYIGPIEGIYTTLADRADALVAHLEDRAGVVKLVSEVVTAVTSTLSALGTVTAGITEVIGIAIQVGHLAWQVRQQGNLLLGHRATAVRNLGNGLVTLADHLDWIDSLINQADAEWYATQRARDHLADQVMASLPADEAPAATGPAADSSAATKTGGTAMVAAALGAVIAILRAA